MITSSDLPNLRIRDDEGYPLRDSDRVYFLDAAIPDPARLAEMTGVDLRRSSGRTTTATLHFEIGRTGAYPTPGDIDWWRTTVSEVHLNDWVPEFFGYADMLAEAAARLLLAGEARALASWLDAQLPTGADVTITRVLSLTPNELCYLHGRVCFEFVTWPSYPLSFTSAGWAYWLETPSEEVTRAPVGRVFIEH